VVDVLDEDSLSLLHGKYPITKEHVFYSALASRDIRRLGARFWVYGCAMGKGILARSQHTRCKRETQRV
jgi:hypothetical protein